MSVFYGNYANGVVMSTRTRLYFIGTFGILCATKLTYDVFFAQPMSPYDVVNISDKRGSKCPQKPQNRPFCSALPSIVNA